MPFGSLNSGSLLILSYLFNVCAVPLTSLEFMRVYVHITGCMPQVSGQILPWEMTFQGGDTRPAPEQLHMTWMFVSLVCSCQYYFVATTTIERRLPSREIGMGIG